MFSLEKDHFHLFIHGERGKLKSLKEYGKFIYDFGCRFLQNLFLALKNFNKPIANYKLGIKDEIVIYVRSTNEVQALEFLKSFPNAKWISYGEFAEKNLSGISINDKITKRPNFSKFIFLIYLFFNPKYGVRYHRKISGGYEIYKEYLFILSEEKPKLIVISNDHSTDCRPLILAAKALDIKTIYLQHASVTTLFPPLRTSHAFLYGEYSRDVYCQTGLSNTKIELVGNPKFDFYKDEILNKKRSYVVGIAFNLLDNLNDVLQFATEILNKLPEYDVILRAHPSDNRSIPSHFLTSDSKKETSQDFLARTDILIAGTSNILLEASSMNVLPLVFYFSKLRSYMYDYYGFIKTGVAIECKSIDDILLWINRFDVNILYTRKMAKVYDASIESDFEFDVSTKVLELINSELPKT